MPVANAAAIIAAEIEKVHSADLEELFQFDAIMWPLIKARPKDTVSLRPERVEFKISKGTKSRAVNLDGGDMGRGAAAQRIFGNIAPVSFDWILEWTELFDIASNSTEKAVVEGVKSILGDNTETAAFNVDSLVSFSQGANELGTVTSYDNVNFIIYVDNAERFYVNQDIDIYNGGVGTAISSTVTITAIEPLTGAVYIAANPTTIPAANATILENNSPGTTGSGVMGYLGYQVNSATGYYLGISRAAYPGLFSTPAVNAANNTLTPAMARLLINQLRIARGVKAKPGSMVKLVMNYDQQAAWENTGINVTQNIQSGDATGRDMLAAEQVETIAGLPILLNPKAPPGRIDLIDFSTYYRTEVQPLDIYSVGNVRLFWPMGASGGIASSKISYMYWMGNVVCENPRKNAYMYNLVSPAGYVI